MLWAGLACAIAAPACSQSEEELAPVTEAAAAPANAVGGAAAPAAVNLQPMIGGVIQALGPYVAELVTREGGRIEAQVRDLQGRPVATDGATMSVEVGGADRPPVQVVMTPEGDRFVGTATGASGPAPVSLYYTPPGQPAEVTASFPQVVVHVSGPAVAPRHQGQVSIVGDNRFEVAAEPDGEVTVSVADMSGDPVPPAEVQLREVTVVTPEGPRVVVLEPRGTVFVGSLGAPPPPDFSVDFDVVVRGRHHPRVHLRHFHPVAPGIVVVAPPPPPSWGPPVVEVYVDDHPGKGWAKGHWMHGGGHPGKGWGHGGGHGGGHGRH
jgi:hypothetical protein